MVLLSCITTRGGDKGQTSLGNGKRVSKHSDRIHAIGDVDEVNSIIGIIHHYVPQDVQNDIRLIQNDLFDIGADLCMPGDEQGLRISEKQVQRLEGWISHYNTSLEPLKSFILPGGHEGASYLHLLRTTSRRCERTLVELNQEEAINPNIICYLNRLSDLAFVWARYVNKVTEVGMYSGNQVRTYNEAIVRWNHWCWANGHGIAQLCLEAGIKTLLIDQVPAQLEKAQKGILFGLSKALEKGIISESPSELLENLSLQSDYQGVAECDLIIEAIVENFEIKRSLYETLASHMHERAILCSNTSSYSIQKLGEGLDCTFVGLHFMNPPTRVRFVEIIPGPNCGEDVLDSLVTFTQGIGCEYCITPDIPGFIVNRLLFSFMGHAFHLAKEHNIPFETIDKALTQGANLPMGPFRLADLIGLDTCKAILQQLATQTGEEQFTLTDDLQKRVESGYLGKKTGRGFFDY